MGIDVVAIVAIVSGVSFVAFLFYKSINFFQFLIERKSNKNRNENDAERLATIEHRQHVLEKRIQNLETIMVDNDLEVPQKTETEPAQKTIGGRLQNTLRP